MIINLFASGLSAITAAVCFHYDLTYAAGFNLAIAAFNLLIYAMTKDVDNYTKGE